MSSSRRLGSANERKARRKLLRDVEAYASAVWLSDGKAGPGTDYFRGIVARRLAAYRRAILDSPDERKAQP